MLSKLWETIDTYNSNALKDEQLDHYDVLDTINDPEDPEEVEMCIREIQNKI